MKHSPSKILEDCLIVFLLPLIIIYSVIPDKRFLIKAYLITEEILWFILLLPVILTYMLVDSLIGD